MMTIESEISRKATRDAAFKAQLMHNPRAVFLSEYGVELPEDLQLSVLERAGGVRVELPSLESTRLSDGDVEVVAAFAAPDGSCTTWWTQTTNCS